LEYRTPGEVSESAHDLVRLLDHRKLILADWYESGSKTCNVGSLTHRISEETRGQSARQPAKLDLVPDGWVPLEPRDGDEIQIKNRKLGKLRDRGLERDGRDRRIDSDSQIIECDVEHVLPNVPRAA
jgi:hypothetical protein